MKKAVILAFSILFLTNVNAQELKDARDSLSYAVGVLWGQNIKQQGLTDINVDVLSNAISAAISDGEMSLDLQSANMIVREFMNREKAAAGNKNKAEGDAFLKKNAEREGVITLKSGLQYEVILEGTGPIPTSSDKVSVHYHGTLINGDVFDSSVQRGSPASFPVTGVIKGWVEALQLMPVGSKWKLFIPADLAYGDRGAGGKIGANATLVFEVELLGIE